MSTVLGRFLRFVVPDGVAVPILTGPLRGRRWMMSAGRHVCWLGTYERTKAGLFADHSEGAGLVFDVGAHAGYYTLIAAAKGAHVVAVEPLKLNVRHLRRHLDINGFDATVVKAATWRQSGSVSFRVHGTYMGRVGSGTARVPAVRLDELADTYGNPDLVKMDIEGGEVAALAGAEDILSSATATWFIATHGDDARRYVVGTLTEYGYRIVWLADDELIAAPA